MAERDSLDLPNAHLVGSLEDGASLAAASWRPSTVTVSFADRLAAAREQPGALPRKRVFGAYRGRFSVPDDFFRPLAEHEV
jgi:hypothetical protein